MCWTFLQFTKEPNKNFTWKSAVSKVFNNCRQVFRFVKRCHQGCILTIQVLQVRVLRLKTLSKLYPILPPSTLVQNHLQHSNTVIGAGIGIGFISVLVETNTDRKSTRLNSSHVSISYAVFCLQKKKYEYP